MSKSKKIKRVIVLICDTLRAKNVGVYNPSIKTTPFIDKFSKDAIVFENSYTTITCTDPSITAIMTGNYPLSSGLVNHGKFVSSKEEQNIKNIPTLAQILKDNNFKTMAVDWLGRWHKKGFDYYSGKIKNDYKKPYPIAQYLPFPLAARILDKIFIKYLKREFFLRYYYAFTKNPKIPYDPADVVVDKAVELLNENKKNKLFLYLHFWDAHSPHTKPKGLHAYLKDNIEDTYNAEINFLDAQIGRFIKYLKDQSLLKDSLIVLTSDHGENLFEHDIPLNHENLKDDVVKVPLIIKHPQLSPKIIKTSVQTIDIFPTILEILKINFQKNIDGKSLLPLYKKNKSSLRDFVFFEDITYRKLNFPKNTRRRGVLIADTKYIQKFTGPLSNLYSLNPKEFLVKTTKEAFNPKKDPQEKNNLRLENQNLKKIINSLNLNYFKLHNPNLYKKILIALKVIKQADSKYRLKNIAIAWKGGKDTTVLMHILRNHYGFTSSKIMFNDTTLEFEETYDFIKKVSKLWNLDLLVIPHDAKELEEYHSTHSLDRKKELSRFMKITAINKALKENRFKGFMLGIRRDEHPARANERYFSKRKDHIRIHPLLDWSEKDIWEYTNHFGVPYSTLYNKGYRSVGEKEFTKKAGKKSGERSGREQEKEILMGRLRKLGYW